MKTKAHHALMTLLLLGTAPAIFAQQAIDNLVNAHKYSLADSYFQVGAKFIELGDKERGDEFQEQAKLIFPGYQPGVPPKAAPAGTAKPAAPAPAATAVTAPVTDANGIVERPQVVEKNLQAEKIAKLQFSRLLRGYIDADADTMASVLADQVSLNGKKATQAEAKDQINAFLKINGPQAGSPDELYEISTLTAAATASGVVLTVNAKADVPGALKEKLGDWKVKQSFTFLRTGLTWKLAEVKTE